MCPWSVARFFGGFSLTLGLLGSLLALLGWLFGFFPELLPGPLFLSAFLGTVFYGVMGYLSGLLTAFIYNLIANAFGGIRVDLEEKK
jgi:hypothetical protein